MDTESVCYDFHLRMTVATTEHERFDQLLSALVPTPDAVVTPQNLTAINDARNILVETIGAVCETYSQLVDCDDLNPDEAKVMDDAYATVQKWNGEVEMLMVQIQQIVWDNQHGHIRRLISGTHSRRAKEPEVTEIPEIETPAQPVTSTAFREAPDESIEVVTPEDDEESDHTDDAQPDEVEEQSETEDPSADPVIETAVEPDEEPTTIIYEPPEDPVQPVQQPVANTISKEQLEDIRAEARAEGYAQAVAEMNAQIQKGASDVSVVTASAKQSSTRKTAKPAKKSGKKSGGILHRKGESQ